jgi:hypothetical protein
MCDRRRQRRSIVAARASLAEVRAICAPLEAKPTLERAAALEHQVTTAEVTDA